MDNKTSYPVKKSFCISGRNLLQATMAFLLFAVAMQAHAQPYTACFNMSTTQICAGQTVTFTDCSNSIAGILTPGDGGSPIQLDVNQKTNTYTYNTPGVYQPFQTVNCACAAGNNDSPTQTLTVVNNVSTPTFTIDNCSGNQVKINITDNNYDTYEIAWGDPSSSVSLASPLGSSTFTYLTNGTYSITVTGKFLTATCPSTPVTINNTTLNSLIAPVIKDLTVNSQSTNGSVTLQFTTVPTQQYAVEEQEGGMGYNLKTTVLYPSSSPQTLSFFNLNTATDPFYYRIYTYDNCGSPNVYSTDIYTAVLTGTASNNQNNLTWTDFHTFLTGDFDHYELYKDGVLVYSGPLNTYTDNAVTCEQTYMYQVLTYTNSSVPAYAVAYSAYIPVKAISTTIPTTITNPNVTVTTGGQTFVAWETPTSFTPSTYQIQRSDNGGPYLTVGTMAASSSASTFTYYTDNGSSPGSSSMCYQITYTDVCNNTAAYSVNTCPVLLQMTTTTTDNVLTWSSYTGYYASGILRYDVEVLDANNVVIRTIPVGMSLTYTDPIDPTASILRYRIHVVANTPSLESQDSESNIVDVSFMPQLHIPTAFTPNADGNNDKFLVKGRYIKEYKMTIFNQWGQAIFISNDPNIGWDGTYNGENCVVDDYAWIVTAKDNKGEGLTEKGVVTLIR